MNLLDTLALKKAEYQQAGEMDQDSNSKQQRDALLLAFLHMNPQMLQQLGSRSQEYLKGLLSQQGEQK